jgi:hypothetical protein
MDLSLDWLQNEWINHVGIPISLLWEDSNSKLEAESLLFCVTLWHVVLSEDKHHEELSTDNTLYKLAFQEADNYLKYFDVLSGKQEEKSDNIKDYEIEAYIRKLNLSIQGTAFLIHCTPH